MVYLVYLVYLVVGMAQESSQVDSLRHLYLGNLPRDCTPPLTVKELADYIFANCECSGLFYKTIHRGFVFLDFPTHEQMHKCLMGPPMWVRQQWRLIQIFLMGLWIGIQINGCTGILLLSSR